MLEAVLVDLDPEAGQRPGRHAPVADFRWLGQEIVGEVEEVAGLGRAWRRPANADAKATVASAPMPPSYCEPTTTGTARPRQRPRMRRDSVKPVRATFTETMPTAPSSSSRATWARLMQRLVADQRYQPAFGEPGAAAAVLGRDRFLDGRNAEVGQRFARAERVLVAPAAVGVHVELGVGQCVAHRAHRCHVGLHVAADLDLEGPDAVPLVHRERLLGHRCGRGEADHVRDRDVWREAAQQRRARPAEDLADEVPYREVDRAARHPVPRRAAAAASISSVASGSMPSSAGPSRLRIAATIVVCVSP